jgi:hypothetical protein
MKSGFTVRGLLVAVRLSDLGLVRSKEYLAGRR